MMTIKDFSTMLKKTPSDVKKFIDDMAPRIAGQIAIQHAKQNFQQESFEGQKWKEVNRRIPSTATYRSALKNHKARTNRKILTGDSGDLRRSIKADYEKNEVRIYSDKVYARVHNEGLPAGRGKGFTMPKRQFIGSSKELENKVKKTIQREFKRLFKQ